MRLRAALLTIALAFAALPLTAQQPQGVVDALANLTDQPASRVSFTFDRSMLQSAQDLFGAGSPSALTAVTVDTYRYSQPAFYTPEAFAALVADYNAAGWKHLVNTNASPGQNAQPDRPLTDLWLHYEGTEVRDLTVMLRSPRTMNVIQVSGTIRPLDLLHIAGHFGIPKVDPNAVMVPAPPGR